MKTRLRSSLKPVSIQDAAPDLWHFINGVRRAGEGTTAPVYNPSIGEVVAHVPLATAAEARLAVDCAAAAYPAWAGTSPSERARVVSRFCELCNSHLEELAAIISTENGKLLADARGSVRRGIEVLEFARGIPHLMKGEFSDGLSRGMDMYSMRKPLGIVVGITPFNFPAMVPLWMVALGVACGNSFILKPSEKTPSCALRLAELFLEAGLPQGVFQVINGNKEAVDALLADKRVQAISFVGSTPVAARVYEKAAAQGKRCQAMGGAKNHLVVMPDADLEQAVDALIGAAYGSAGQRCMAISVGVAVGKHCADALVGRLQERIAGLRVGMADDPKADFGPLVSPDHLQRVQSYVDLCVSEGGKLVIDGRKWDLPAGGFFMGPCLLDGVGPEMKSYQDEIFGPVLQIVRVESFEAALALPSSHPYGNGVSIFTQNGTVARNFADRVETGMVGINVPIPVPAAFHSFGGWKGSAFGDMNIYGLEGVRFYTRTKTVTSRWTDMAREGAKFEIPVLK